jgi:hypothetical protein
MSKLLQIAVLLLLAATSTVYGAAEGGWEMLRVQLIVLATMLVTGILLGTVRGTRWHLTLAAMWFSIVLAWLVVSFQGIEIRQVLQEHDLWTRGFVSVQTLAFLALSLVLAKPSHALGTRLGLWARAAFAVRSLPTGKPVQRSTSNIAQSMKEAAHNPADLTLVDRASR